MLRFSFLVIFLGLFLVFARIKAQINSPLSSYPWDARRSTLEILNKVICHKSPVYGKCQGNRTMWFFNHSKAKCQNFIYSNCGGNNNRFYSKQECDEFCTSKIDSWKKLHEDNNFE